MLRMCVVFFAFFAIFCSKKAAKELPHSKNGATLIWTFENGSINLDYSWGRIDACCS